MGVNGSSSGGASTGLATWGSSGSSSSGPAVGESSGGVEGDGILQCVESCLVPANCCVLNTPNCPGYYPYNFSYEEGLCVPGQCENDGECDGVVSGQVCRMVRGLRTCVTPCTPGEDGPCDGIEVGMTCSGVTQEGEGFCFKRCDAPGESCGGQDCDPDSGLCVCSTSGQCQTDWECVD